MNAPAQSAAPAATVEIKQLLTMDEAAQLLNIGPRKLREVLRARHILQSDNQPHAKFIRDKLFTSSMRAFQRGPVTRYYTVTKVTALGLAKLREIVTAWESEQKATKKRNAT